MFNPAPSAPAAWIFGSLLVIFGHGQTRTMRVRHDLSLPHSNAIWLDLEGRTMHYPHDGRGLPDVK